MTTFIFNANIYVERDVFAHAMIIDGGVIQAVGGEAELRARLPEEHEEIDCGGRTVVPGFIDTHLHLVETGVSLNDIDLSGCRSIQDVRDAVAAYIAERRPAPGTVLHGWGWNQDYFTDEVRILEASDIDPVSPDHPLILDRACAHLLTCNTAALRAAGMTRDVQAPEGGYIGRREDGELNGVFAENAIGLVRSLLKNRTAEEEAALIRLAMNHAAENGVTSVHTCDLRPGTWRTTLEAYRMVQAENPTTRIYHQSNFMDPVEYREFLDAGCTTGSGDAFNRFGPLKLFLDGSLGARTAEMRRPYHDAPDTTGISTLTEEALNELVETAVSRGCSVCAHAIGDRAIERMLDAYERVCPHGQNPNRLGVVHVQITDRELIQRFKDQDILAYIQPIFLHYDRRIVEARVGRELASTSYAFGTMARLGIHASYGTDCPIEDLNPFHNIYCAITRKSLDGSPEGGFFPEECVDVQTAVDAYTTAGAYAEFAEDRKGRLQPGCCADLAVLSTNIFTASAEEIRDAHVEMTMVDGRIVHRTSSF